MQWAFSLSECRVLGWEEKQNPLSQNDDVLAERGVGGYGRQVVLMICWEGVVCRTQTFHGHRNENSTLEQTSTDGVDAKKVGVILWRPSRDRDFKECSCCRREMSGAVILLSKCFQEERKKKFQPHRESSNKRWGKKLGQIQSKEPKEAHFGKKGD